MKSRVKVGVVGGAGYTAGELLRLLINHPQVEIDFVYSTSNAGNPVSDVHDDLVGQTDWVFSSQVNPHVDMVFLCLGHGNSAKFLAANSFSEITKIIDLSNDFRLRADAVFQGKKFVYGLPELNLEEIKNAQYIANPGCFATTIQLALLPLAKHGKIKSEVHINATTGATGAGVSPSATTHFSWRDNNFSVYKAFTHQHLGEINESLVSLQPGLESKLFFIPNRGNFSRGIFASVYLDYTDDLESAYQIFEAFYKDAPFTQVSRREIHLKQVVNTNNCIIHLHKYQNKLLITSITDNLLKGASGQAVQNMNLMLGIDQSTGLKLKGSGF